MSEASAFDRGKCCYNCYFAVGDGMGNLRCTAPDSLFVDRIVFPEDGCLAYHYEFPFCDGDVEMYLRTIDRLCKCLRELRKELAEVRAKQDFIEPLKWSKPKTICDGYWTQWRAKLDCLTFLIDKHTDDCGDVWSFSAKLGGKKKIIKTLEEAKARVELLREAIIMTAKGGAK